MRGMGQGFGQTFDLVDIVAFGGEFEVCDGALDFAMFKTDISVTEVAKWVRQSFGKIDGDLNFYFFNRTLNRYGNRPGAESDRS